MSFKFTAIFALGLLLLASCRQAEQEAARTKDQLGGVARAIGADELVDSVAKSYSDNLHPMMKEAGGMVENYQAVQVAKEMGSQACEKISAFGSDVGVATERMMSRLPQNERELNQTIDYYNDEFVDWMRENFKGLDLSASRTQIKNRIEPRAKPKTLKR